MKTRVNSDSNSRKRTEEIKVQKTGLKLISHDSETGWLVSLQAIQSPNADLCSCSKLCNILFSRAERPQLNQEIAAVILKLWDAESLQVGSYSAITLSLIETQFSDSFVCLFFVIGTNKNCEMKCVFEKH